MILDSALGIVLFLSVIASAGRPFALALILIRCYAAKRWLSLGRIVFLIFEVEAAMAPTILLPHQGLPSS